MCGNAKHDAQGNHISEENEQLLEDELADYEELARKEFEAADRKAEIEAEVEANTNAPLSAPLNDLTKQEELWEELKVTTELYRKVAA